MKKCCWFFFIPRYLVSLNFICFLYMQMVVLQDILFLRTLYYFLIVCILASSSSLISLFLNLQIVISSVIVSSSLILRNYLIRSCISSCVIESNISIAIEEWAYKYLLWDWASSCFTLVWFIYIFLYKYILNCLKWYYLFHLIEKHHTLFTTLVFHGIIKKL